MTDKNLFLKAIGLSGQPTSLSTILDEFTYRTNSVHIEFPI